MLLLRRFELGVQENYKAGRMPGFVHLYIGQEAVAVGVCAHLGAADWMTSTHRGHGHALAKGVAPDAVMAELYGKATGCNGGRGGSMHLYDADVGLLGTNGFVGGGLPSAVGAALSCRVRDTKGVAVAFFGDGAVNHGSFHESVNLAGALGAPVVFVCENNLYATATPLRTATKNIDVASRGAAYGIPGVAVDGNDVVALWQAAGEAVERARRGAGPTLLEARTYRTVGHHEGDPLVGTYRTQDELDAWKARDPLNLLRDKMLESGMEQKTFDEIEARVNAQVAAAVARAEAAPQPAGASARAQVWAAPQMAAPAPMETREQGWLDAVRDGIAEEMRANSNVIYLGEGIGERGGSFAHTKGLWQEFGAGRVIDTPICELGFTGASAGAAATGCPAVADLMFSDFLFEAASQIVQQAGKLRYLTGGKVGVPLVIRSGMGAIKNAGAHHSGCYYPMWAHCPGLLVAVPATPADAKGLWKTALRGADPVLMFEHKLLFSSKGQVPVGDYALPFGQAAIARAGNDLTLVACGLMVSKCLEAAAKLRGEIECEVVDLRTLVPLDVETIVASVSKTGRVLVVDEAFAFCGLGAEIAAIVQEHAFDELDAPVGRLHTEPVTQPFAPSLEDEVVVTTEKIVAAARDIVAGRAPWQDRAPRLRSAPDAHRATEAGVAIAPNASAKVEAELSDLRDNSNAGLAAANGANANDTNNANANNANANANDANANANGANANNANANNANANNANNANANNANANGANANGANANGANANGGVPIVPPNQDLTVTEGTVAHWLVEIGDSVEKGAAVCEIETAKAVIAVEAPASGTLRAISALAGETVPMKSALGWIEEVAA